MSAPDLVKCPRPGCGKLLSPRGLPRHAKSKHVRGMRCEEPDCETPAAGMAKNGGVYCDGHMRYHQ